MVLTYNEIAGRIKDGSNGDVAIDQYHHYKVYMMFRVHNFFNKKRKEKHS